jgi:hypothetical protein
MRLALAFKVPVLGLKLVGKTADDAVVINCIYVVFNSVFTPS